MRLTSHTGLSTIAFATTILLTACGGGGGGTPTADTTAQSVTYNTEFALPTNSDTYTGSGGATSWGGDGDGYGGYSGTGQADSAGGAGDGEFILLTGRLPDPSVSGQQQTLTWKVLRSQYGQKSATGTLTVEKDLASAGGGYKVVAVNGSSAAVRTATQSNIFVSKTGVVSGTLPLTIAGSVRDTAFTALRLQDANANPSSATDFSAMAGTYAYGYFTADVSTGANRTADGGWMKINADGTGRMCDGAGSFTSNCANGIDIVAKYESGTQSIFRVKEASTQSQPIPTTNNDRLNALVVAKPVVFSSGVAGAGVVTGYTLSADVLSWDSRDTSKPVRTGISYASRSKDSSNANAVQMTSSSIVGSYSMAINETNPPKAGYFFLNIANTTSGVQAMGSSPETPTVCSNTSFVVSQYSEPGVFTASAQINAVSRTNFLIYIDVDSFVYVPDNNSGIGVMRRFSSTAGLGPLQSCLPV